MCLLVRNGWEEFMYLYMQVHNQKKGPTLMAVRFDLQLAFAKVSRHPPQEISPCEFGPFAKTDRFDAAGHDL